MTTSNSFFATVKKNFGKFFDKSVINKIAKSSGFRRRKPKKINPFDFILGFMFCCSKKSNTFNEWAIQISKLSKKTVTSQGVCSRINVEASDFARQLLEYHLLNSTGFKMNYPTNLFGSFDKVYLQDSTALKLPDLLADLYPGNVVNGVKKAIARIQTVLDIKTMQFADFKLCAYTQNDQSASKDITRIARGGDLVIRDMGYFVMQAFEDMAYGGIHFLSRLRYGTNIYDEAGNIISMASLLKKRKGTDIWVCIGKNNKVPVRLIMIPLPAAVAAERVRKARQHPDKRLNHSDEYYKCLQFGIFITSVDKDIWTAQQIAKVYRLRWQIEIIFKSWKSGFSMQEVLHERCDDENRVNLCIWLMLLFICLFMQKIYMPCKEVIERRTDKAVNLLKVTTYFINNFIEILILPEKSIRQQIERSCCYDKRSSRLNMTDLINEFKN